MKKDHANAIETVAHRAAMDAYLETFVKNLKGLPITVLLGTRHEHVAVMRLTDGSGLECRVHVSFADKQMSQEMVKGFESLRGVDIDKLMRPPRA